MIKRNNLTLDVARIVRQLSWDLQEEVLKVRLEHSKIKDKDAYLRGALRNIMH